ncbi:ribokinase [Frondihabitans cladoniiphilus]|uniref:Ribokinase n=1 Tax=Frondihabitans cladoniiphilus TaxID=715785 RepID=A0ABP8W0K3_9MICO
MALSVVVIGSANLDYLVRVPAHVRPGETILATGLTKQPGGKGMNQAVSAARLGADVTFVGAVGDDPEGERIAQVLSDEGIRADLAHPSGTPTGIALVSVDDAGENSITVVAGANAAVSVGDGEAAVVHHVRPGTVVVLQGELLAATTESVALAAAGAGGRVVLNLAPFRTTAAPVLALADPLVLNETEAGELLGASFGGSAGGGGAHGSGEGSGDGSLGSGSLVSGGGGLVDGALAAAAELVGSGASASASAATVTVRSVVITLGGKGAVWADASGSAHVVATAPEAVVDTTGAGDAFVGGLVAALATGSSLADAVALGVRAGTFAVGGLGAQSSYARRADLD